MHPCAQRHKDGMINFIPSTVIRFSGFGSVKQEFFYASGDGRNECTYYHSRITKDGCGCPFANPDLDGTCLDGDSHVSVEQDPTLNAATPFLKYLFTCL